jgi:DNA-directed RNA polymerase subunit RPC12/RpoP
VLPPEVLAMEVKFLCTSCKRRLGADAHWEGRGVICPVCGDKTRVPQWSGILHGRRPADVVHGTKAVAFSEAKLSSEEIAFLSEPASAPARAGA